MEEKRAASRLLLVVVSLALASLAFIGVVSAAPQFDLLDFGPTNFTIGVNTYVWVYVKNVGDQNGNFVPEGYSPTTNGWNWSNSQSSLSAGATQNFTNILAVTTNSNASSGQIRYGVSNASDVQIWLIRPNGTAISELQAPTIVRRFETTEIVLPAIEYNVTAYSGQREITVSNPEIGKWALRVGHGNVTRVESVVGWS